ncbi:hypothetical protein POJ06DRAFT_281193 [Lipomyces tetrasporus]|uniref:Uncharacterized protein n=1 Tax=Lipomyces tetrasporus TaxID=54092 RepID=A0AAD7QTX3_9ASCO|nr:uncharacterized protein POJ06DRAFT_281193 [Lipomyces tetrasporus]KAJ8101427.1 hypothetical protein POJ06DRAFT_281193 [Lipomyces tetrasporus]
MPPGHNHAWTFTRRRLFSAQTVGVAVPEMRLSIRKLVYRFNILSLMLALMKSVRTPKPKEKSSSGIKEARRAMFMEQCAARTALAMVDEERRLEIDKEFTEKLQMWQTTRHLSKIELKIYRTLVSMGVDMNAIDIKRMPMNSVELAMMIVRLPESVTQLNSLEENDFGRFYSSMPQRPVYRHSQSKRLNARITAILNSRDDPLVLEKLSKLLMCTSVIPDQSSFDIMIRGLAVKQHHGVAALIVVDALVQSGLEISTYTLVNIVRIGVELRNASILQFMVALLDRIQSDSNDATIMHKYFLHTKVVSALMTACIKLNEPQTYSMFRQVFMKRKLQPTVPILIMEIRFGFLTNNDHIATDAWVALKHMDDMDHAKMTLQPCLWMAKHAERTGNIERMRDIVDVATKRRFLHQLKLQLRRDVTL